MTQALHRYTFREYLALEEASNVKHEFLRGEIYAMAGGTPQHAALGAAVSAALLAQLRGGPCRVYSSDLRIRVAATGLATYPDVTVVCGRSQRDPANEVTVVNPRVVVEVLSPGTEDYDRGEKLEHYKQIRSLAAVILVDYRERRIESHERADQGGAWRHRVAAGGESLAIDALGAVLKVDPIYDDAEEPA
jgi:Uma2 family endonuclease